MSNDNDSKTTRVTLTRGELLQLKGFAESVDPGCEPEDIKWWDHLTNKLERGIARIDGGEPRLTSTQKVEWVPDMCASKCGKCGWEGPLSKTTRCPFCDAKVNPGRTLFNTRGGT